MGRFLAIIPFSMIAFTVTMAPKLEIFTELVCKAQHGIPRDSESEVDAFSPGTDCAKDPRVQATVAVLMTSESYSSIAYANKVSNFAGV